MKLHLTKSLRTALIACVCVAASAYGTTISGTTELDSSAITENVDGSGDLTITGTTSIGGISINNTGTLTFNFSQATQIGTWPKDAAPVNVGSNVTNVTIAGTEAVLTCQSSLNNSGTLTVNEGSRFWVVNGTTVTLNDAITNNGTIILGKDSGATLTLADGVLAKLSSSTADGYSDGVNGFEGFNTTYDLIEGGVIEMNKSSSASVGGKAYALNTEGEFTIHTRTDTTYYVNEGTVESPDISGATAVEVASGATLYFSGHNENNSLNIKLNGGTMDMEQAFNENGATSGAGAYQVFSGTITLADGAHITGGEANGLISNGGSIVATGTGNEISATVSVRKDLTIDVAAEGKLTLSGIIKANPYGTDGEPNVLLKEITKTGEGTLVLGADASLSSVTDNNTGKTYNLGLTISEGTLDLSNVDTLSVEAFKLAAGTTVILGENTRIEFADALTIGEGVIFDVSGWCAYDEFKPYDLFTYTGSGNANVLLPTNVTIHTSTGDNEKAWLEFDADNKTVKLIPEPTTATLSLLALAGLAARRRRK